MLVDNCDAGQLWDPVSSAYFYRFDPDTSSLTTMLSSESSDAYNFTSFLYFTGIWGDYQYADDDPRQYTVPKFGLKRFVSGPTGPMEKQLVRKGMFPGRRYTKTWLEWGVHVFMALYPCCLRGWRAWVSGIAFIGILVSIVLGIVYIVKRYRSRSKGYIKVNTGEGIPMATLNYRDNTAVNRMETG